MRQVKKCWHSRITCATSSAAAPVTSPLLASAKARVAARLAPPCAVLALVLLSACATTSGPDSAVGSDTARSTEQDAVVASDTDALIARSLVSATAQMNDLPPWSTTVQINVPSSSFGSALFNALEEAGYGVQRVPDDQGSHYISHRSSTEQSESGRIYTYSMWVGGGVAIERRFKEAGSTLLPASPVVITGIRPKTITVDDRDFARAVRAGIEFPSGVEFRDDAYELIQSRALTSVTTGGDDSAAAKARRVNELKVEEILAAYRPKRQATLSFPSAANNVLGDPNKRAIVAISEAYRPSTDIFLVSGCRPATYSSPAEPATDSMARANRVRAELLNRGYASGVILQETCEPGRYNEELPRRAVVLTLERLRDT